MDLELKVLVRTGAETKRFLTSQRFSNLFARFWKPSQRPVVPPASNVLSRLQCRARVRVAPTKIYLDSTGPAAAKGYDEEG